MLEESVFRLISKPDHEVLKHHDCSCMSIDIEFVYTCFLAQVEKVSSLSAWRNWGDVRMISESPVKFSDTQLVVSEKIKVRVPVGKGKVVLPADAAVMFEILASVFNPDGVRVRIRGGYARIMLADLLVRDERKFSVDYFNDWDEKGERTQCGTIDVTSVDFVDTKRESISFAEPTPYSFVDSNSDFIAKTTTCIVARKIVAYTDEAAARGKSFTPLRQILTHVQAPWYNATAGVTYGAVFWMLSKTSSDNTEFYDELIGNALFRRNRDKEYFLSTIENQFVDIKENPEYFNDEFNMVVRIIGDVLCMPSTALPYISDFVDANKRKIMNASGKAGLPKYNPKLMKSSESWDCAIVRNGGDCEDLARLIHLTFQGLRTGKFAEGSLAAAAQKVLKLYVGCGSLGSVLSPAMGNDNEPVAKKYAGPNIIDSEEDKKADVGAHMFYEIHPTWKFVEFLQKTTTNLPDSVHGEHREPGWRNLISCILEGTGRLDPFQLPAAAASTSPDRAVREALVEKETNRRRAIRYLVENSSVTSLMQMTRAQKEMKYVPNARFGDFYMQSTSFATLEFMDSLNTVEFMWATLGEREPEEKSDELYMKNVRTKKPLPTAQSIASSPDSSCCCDDESPSDVFSQAASLFEPSLAVGAPLTKPLVIETIKRSTEHQKRVNLALESGFVRGVPSISQALLREEKIMKPAAVTAHETRPNLPIRFGVDTEDKFRVPEARHVAILPTTSLDGVEMRVLAEFTRNLRPASLPGDYSYSNMIHAAEEKSLAAIGVDINKGETESDKAVKTLKKWAHDDMNGENWPTHDEAEKKRLSLVTLFFAKTELRPDSNNKNIVLEKIMSEYGALRKDGVIKSARVGTEVPITKRDQVVLQFMCDTSRLPK